MFAPTDRVYVIEIVQVSNQRGQDGVEALEPELEASLAGSHDSKLRLSS